MEIKKKALICGVSGQDGAYLAQLLISKGYQVWGTSRVSEGSTFGNLKKLGIKEQVNFLSMAPEDFGSVLIALRRSNPDEVYYLAGQSSVSQSFKQPAETMQSITVGTLNILEGCRIIDKKIRIYNAGSGECFGDTNGMPANEKTPFSPTSPYAVAKASAYWLVKNYRDSYGIFTCTGILFNHESPLRQTHFVTQKIIHAVKKITNGNLDKLKLGNLEVSRDWGWAPEYVETMWLMLQQESPNDFVVATGLPITLEDFVSGAFKCAGLNWEKYVIHDEKLFRPREAKMSFGDSAKALKELGWKATTSGISVAQKMYSSLN